VEVGSAIDVKNVRDEITKVMQEEKTAFKLQNEKYGF
jgi:hypothetical protein